MFFAKDLIKRAFQSLCEHQPEAKRGMERTSALMFFLAFDMTQKQAGHELVDCGPKSRWRHDMATNYESLVTVSIRPDSSVWFVTNLGEINRAETRTPQKKIGGDFLTVPVKRASEKSEPSDYPSRPPRPLLRLGVSVPSGKWGVSKHSDWMKNAPHFLADRKTNTPWSALAVFVLRDDKIDGTGDIFDATRVAEALGQKFTSELSKFWMRRLDAEKFPPPCEIFQSAPSHSFDENDTGDEYE